MHRRVAACLGMLSLVPVFVFAALAPRTGAQDGDKVKIMTNSIGMKLAPVPAGKFQMGSPETEEERDTEEAQHEVVISKPFHMGVHEVTQEQFARVTGKNPSFFHDKNGGGPDHPVDQVQWAQ